MSDGAKIFRGLLHIDAELAKHGVPPMSPRWREEARRFYLHPTARLWVGCIGRGAGKNLMGVKCDIAETLYSDIVVPPGERHFAINISENKDECAKTLRITDAYLTFLGVPHTTTADTIELTGELRDRGIRILAARIGAASGWRSFGYTFQEPAKWNSEGTNPAGETHVSTKAMTVTHPYARGRVFSSPMGHVGFFSDLIDLGDTEDQVLSQGATWEFNETVSEEQTHRLERDPRRHAREYGGKRQAAALGVHEPDDVAWIFRPRPEPKARERRVCIIDAASGGVDRFTWCALGWDVAADDSRYLMLDALDALNAAALRAKGSTHAVDRVVAFCEEHSIKSIHGDQRDAFHLRDAFAARGLHFTEHTWGPNKSAAVEVTRRWVRDRVLACVPHDDLRKELLMFEETMTASGTLTFAARGSGHDDYVSLLVTAAMADLAGELAPPTKILMPSNVGVSRWGRDAHRSRGF